MKQLIKIMMVCFISLSFQSCTDLDAEIYSEILPEDFFVNSDQAASANSTAYVALYRYWSLHKLSESITDVATKPIRSNNGWGGQFEIQHDFRADSGDQNAAWTTFFGGVATCNRLIEVFSENPNLGPDSQPVAELTALRAFYYFTVLELFKNIPNETRFAEADPTPFQESSEESFAFIETELLSVIERLNENTNETYAKMNKWVAYTLLTKLYINAERFDAGQHWNEAAEAANMVINSGKYSIEPNYFANFTTNNEGSNENIFVIPYDKSNATNFALIFESLNQSADKTFGLSSIPWGGYSFQEDFYNSFEENDKRTGMFIVGQQYTINGVPSFSEELGFFYANPKPEYKLYNKIEDYLNFSVADRATIENDSLIFITANYQKIDGRYMYKNGAKYGKYEIEVNNQSNGVSNDFPIYRYSDVLLMRAEALWRVNPASAEALFLVNTIRTRVGLTELGALTENDLYQEIKKELAIELHSRSTTIRFGHWEDTWFLKTDTDVNHRWFPIPENQLQANVNLVQNPGYYCIIYGL